MPRLGPRPRPSAAASSPAPARPQRSFPAYEPPACPLNATAGRALVDLSNGRDAGAYGNHIKDSLSNIGISLSDLTERFVNQRDRLANMRRRREEKGIQDKTPDEVRLETHLAKFEAEVEAMTTNSEKAIRNLVDYKVELEDEGAVMGDLYSSAAAQQTEIMTRRRAAQQQAAEGEDTNAESELDVMGVSTRDAFRERRQAKQAEFDQMSMHQRYGQNNDYAGFKKLWHDAAQGEDGPPLADASRWFRSDGEPVMSLAIDADDMGGDDDDIAVSREVVSVRCPLTLRPMEEPYSNHKCKHTFEKSAILDYLPARGNAQCPQTGCSQARRLPFLVC